MPFFYAVLAGAALILAMTLVWISSSAEALIGALITLCAVIAVFFKAISSKNKKLEKEAELLPTGLANLFPAFYHPLHIGQLQDRKALGEKELKELHKFPLVWKESLAGERRSFDRFKEKDIFKKVMAANGVTIILGEPGAGKSTLMLDWSKRTKSLKGWWEKFVSLLRGEQKKFFIPLRSVKEESLGSFFKKHFNLDVSSLAVNKNSPPVFLFDGWDELPRPSRSTWKEAIEKLPGIKVVTCRTAYYQNDFKPKPYYLLGLLKEEQRTFLKELAVCWSEGNSTDSLKESFNKVNDTWADLLADQIQSHSQLSLISGSPLLLTLIAYTSQSGEETELPRNRAGFYEKALENLFDNKMADNPDSILLPYLQDFLETLAGDVGRETKITKKDLKNAYVKWKGANPTAPPEENLREAARVCGILQSDRAKTKYQFLHLTFQEWLLAEALYKKQGLLKTVEDYWRDAEYDEALALAWSSATVDEREKATQYLIEAGCQDAVVPAGEPHKYRSGLRTALHLWSRSGEELEGGNSAAFDMLMTAVSKSKLRKRAVAQDDFTPGNVLLELTKDSDERVRRGVAWNSSAPENALRKLVKDKESEVRRGVAQNSSTLEDILRTLAKDKDVNVRTGVAVNSFTPENILQRLAEDKHDLVRIGVAINRSMLEDILRTLAKDKDVNVRYYVARNSSTPVDILRTLAKDKDDVVRSSVAGNNSTPESVLLELAKGESVVRSSIAGNNSTPEYILRALVKDRDKYVRKGVARNRSAPGDVLQTLAEDEDSWVRRGVAFNSSTPKDILRALAEDKDDVVRKNVAGNISAPKDVLRELEKDWAKDVRFYLAQNNSTPEEVLRALANDKNDEVRKGVAWNPNACLEWF